VARICARCHGPGGFRIRAAVPKPARGRVQFLRFGTASPARWRNSSTSFSCARFLFGRSSSFEWSGARARGFGFFPLGSFGSPCRPAGCPDLADSSEQLGRGRHALLFVAARHGTVGWHNSKHHRHVAPAKRQNNIFQTRDIFAHRFAFDANTKLRGVGRAPEFPRGLARFLKEKPRSPRSSTLHRTLRSSGIAGFNTPRARIGSPEKLAVWNPVIS